MKWAPIAAGLLLAGFTSTVPVMAQSRTCEGLAALTIPNATVTLAQTVAAGAFTPPIRGGGPGAQGGGRGRGPQFTDVPAFCRVQATLTPTSDSDIKMELWLPAASAGGSGAPRWNGKFRGTGNGGLGGGAGVNAGQLAAGVRAAYAAAGHNTGHDGDSSYALDHPEKIKDFGYRSAHEMTVASKVLIKAFYGMDARLSYMAEGGGGTIAALSSAQRYPGDFDAIAVTGMSSYLTRHTFGQMWIWQATHKDAASFIPPEKYSVLHSAALDKCDALDGLKDGIIGDVPHCKFDPGVTICKGSGNIDQPGCLTAPQVEAARKIYAGPKNPRTGEDRRSIRAASSVGDNWRAATSHSAFLSSSSSSTC
jgi:feruloyl esterase